jgi:hypothetical protein
LILVCAVVRVRESQAHIIGNGLFAQPHKRAGADQFLNPCSLEASAFAATASAGQASNFAFQFERQPQTPDTVSPSIRGLGLIFSRQLALNNTAPKKTVKNSTF